MCDVETSVQVAQIDNDLSRSSSRSFDNVPELVEYQTFLTLDETSREC